MTYDGDRLSVNLTGPRRDAGPYFILSSSRSVGLSSKPGLTARSATPLSFLDSAARLPHLLKHPGLSGILKGAVTPS